MPSCPIILVTGANRGKSTSYCVEKRKLIGGCSIGLGFAIIQALATRAPGSILCLGCRSVNAGAHSVQELRRQGVNSTIEVVDLDVTKDSSIKCAAKFLSQKYGKIDGELRRNFFQK